MTLTIDTKALHELNEWYRGKSRKAKKTSGTSS